MEQCWVVNPKDRPTFGELRAKFDTLISAQKEDMPYIDLDIDSSNPYYDHLSLDSSDNDEASLTANVSKADQTNLASREIASLSSSLAMGLDGTSNIPEPVPNPYVDTPAFSVTCNGANSVEDKFKE